MVSPCSTAEVAGIVRACANAGVGLVPQGGNTGLCGGAIPDRTGEQVLLSMSRMNAIRNVDTNNFSMIAEAGCVLADVQAAAAAANRLFALSLAAEGSCQIGGNLSTNAGGVNVVRYGTAREQVLGLEVVLADGTIWDGLRSLRKDTAGYDVKQLFLGSEGTLGIITAAALRLFPLPANPVTAMVALGSADKAVDLFARVRESLTDQILAFELIARPALDFVLRHIPNTRAPFDTPHACYVLLDADVADDDSRLQALLFAALEQGLADDVLVAKSTSEAAALWRLRHSISEAQKFEGASLKHDISVPTGRIGEFLRLGARRIAAVMPQARLVAFGHVGDGNLHYNVSQPVDMDANEFLAGGTLLTEAIYDLVLEMGGSISAEHGIGVLKKAALQKYRGGPELRLMRTLKQALDPQCILNPGKVI